MSGRKVNVVQANSRMAALMSRIDDMTKVVVPDALQCIVAMGTTEVGDCVVLKELWALANVSEADFIDATGFECFVNHIHVDDCAADDLVQISVSTLNRLSRHLRQGYPSRRFVGIIAYDDVSCTVRFHTDRLAERYLAAELEEYDEAVCVIEL